MNRQCGKIYEKRADGLMHCDYCGSIDAATAVAALYKNGTEYSGSDWKYGWPHKFYIVLATESGRTNVKFYATHLCEASEDLLEMWNRVSETTTGVKYTHSEEGLRYQTSCKQIAGTVGGERRIYG